MGELNIVELKQKYGKIYKVSFDKDTDYYIRQLKRSEYKAILDVITANNAKPEIHDEKVVTAGVVYPQFTPDMMTLTAAGHVPTLAVKILEKSGFTTDVSVDEV